MSLFARRRESAPVAVEERAQRVDVTGGGYFWSLAGMDAVSDPLRSIAHWAARRVLCTSIASLPVQQIRERRDGHDRLPLSPIVERPARTVKRKQWVYQVMDSWLDAGNAYGNVLATTSTGLPLIVETVSPKCVKWLPVDGFLVPHVNGAPRELWPVGDLWHAPCFVQAGSPIGLSPSEYAAQSVATAVAAEKFGGDFFASSGHPTYDVAAKTDLTEEQAQRVKAGFIRSVKDREPWVHGSGIEAKPMTIDPEKSQFIELLRFECEQAARVYGVPPTMIYAAVSGSAVTYANATQDDLAFLKHSLRWWVTLLQDEWSAWLPAPQVVRFNVDAFLQMTTRERAEVHEIRLRTRTRTVNEVRRLEDEEPFGPEFDVPGVPGGMPGQQLQLPMGDDDGGGA